MARTAIALLALFLLACGGSRPEAARPDPNAPPAERIVASLESLSSQLQAAGADCDRVASALATWTETHRAGYSAASRDAAGGQLADDQRAGYESRLEVAFVAILDASNRCASHQSAQAAFVSFDVLVDPQ